MRCRAALVLALSAPLLPALPAAAQQSPAQIAASKKAAAELANSAFDAFRAGKYEEAITGFGKAEHVFHAPKFLLYIARAQVKLGRLVAAKETYQSILKEQLTTYAPPEFFDAQLDAKKELAALVPRIPTLTILAREGITAVTLDGRPAAVGRPITVDPGEHSLEGAASGSPEVRRKVTVAEGERRTETLEVPSAQGPTATATGEEAPPPGATATTDSGPPTLTWAAYGVGAAGAVVWGVFGGLTASKHHEYNRAPTAERLQEGQAFSLVADIGFGVTMAGAAAGTIYWIVRSASKSSAPPSNARFFVAPAAGTTGGGVAVSGRF